MAFTTIGKEKIYQLLSQGLHKYRCHRAARTIGMIKFVQAMFDYFTLFCIQISNLPTFSYTILYRIMLLNNIYQRIILPLGP